MKKIVQLKKELSLYGIFAIAVGSTIASGFFLLPGLAFAKAGPAMIVAYLIAAIPVIPSIFSKTELATAMPRAGGVYFFLDRSMGPLMGSIGGIGTWLVLVLKTSFALVGIGAYLALYFPKISLTPVSVAFAVIFGWVNLAGAKSTSRFQNVFVTLLLLLLTLFVSSGMVRLDIRTIRFGGTDWSSVFSTAGLVYVSYVGLSKVASISEEVKNPEKNIPKAMFLALGTAFVIYLFGNMVIMAALPSEVLANNLTPVATAAQVFIGSGGTLLMTAAALFAFLSVANAGIMSASRYPLAMSRDHLLPPFFRKLSARQIPVNAVMITVFAVIVVLIVFDPAKIAKLAGAFQLILFALNSLAVIVMRESRIESYDPGFKSPFYPWMQIFGIIAPVWLIVEMGWLPGLFTVALFALGIFWYFYYAKNRVVRDGAIYHIFARLGENRFDGLDTELRGILKEKGLRDTDPFDTVITGAPLIDIRDEKRFEDVVIMASKKLARILNTDVDKLIRQFQEGTLIGATPVAKGAALPHVRLKGIEHSELVMVRARKGVMVNTGEDISGSASQSNKIYAFFFLVSPEENPGQHLRILAQIASHVDNSGFLSRWKKARNEQELKELLLRDDRFIRLTVKKDGPTGVFAGRRVRELPLPEGCLIALIHRENKVLVPKGDSVLMENDTLTIIGYPEGIKELYGTYG